MPFSTQSQAQPQSQLQPQSQPQAQAQQPRRVEADDAGQRVDRYLRRVFPFAPHSLVQKWLRSGQVRLNGARVKADARLSEDDMVRLPPQAEGTTRSVRTSEGVRTHKKTRATDKQTLSLLKKRILLERDDFFLLDKPSGLACQGGRGVAQSLDRQLLALAENLPSLGTPRLVHRLDRETSGLLLVGKNRRAAAELARLFREGKVRKTYCAILKGMSDTTKGKKITCTSPLIDKRKGEQEATTHLFLLDQNKTSDRSLVLLRPVSGRKHQLRRHMAAAGTPVLGERLYALRTEREVKNVSSVLNEDKPARLMLHALRVEIEEEKASRYAVDAHLAPPADFVSTCNSLRLDSWCLYAGRLKNSCLDP